MSLGQLELRNIRNIEQVKIKPHNKINLISGPNGSGKSSLLEAIYLLGRGKSFRTSKTKEVIQIGSNSLIVSGQACRNDCHPIQIGIEIGKDKKDIKISGVGSKSISDLAKSLPVQIIHPGSALLLEGSPKFRREFVDWGVFHVEHDFLNCWRRYRRALNQRNALIKDGNTNGSNSWDQELTHYGMLVSEYRANYIELLKCYINSIVVKFLDCKIVDIRYISGWDTSIGFLNDLERNWCRDLKYGFTQVGPHRSDFVMSYNGHPVKDFMSRGQQKILILCLILAQTQLLADQTAKNSCILIDDLASELDKKNRNSLFEFLLCLNVQFFITTTKNDGFRNLQTNGSKMFHMEHGEIITN